MRYPLLYQRPEYFTLNPNADLAQGLAFAGLGRFPGGFRYDDATESLWGGGNAGTLTNMDPATDWVWSQELGRFALEFVGASSQYVRNASPTVLPANTDITLSLWANLAADAKNVFRWLDDDWTQGIALQAGNNAIACYVNGADANIYKGGMSIAGLHHLCYRKPYAAAYGDFYLDGSPYALTNTTDKTSENISGGAMLEIGGKSTDPYSSYCTGAIADVVVHSRCISADEIAALADPTNIDLRTGGVPLILPPRRRVFPAAVSVMPWLYCRQPQVIGGGLGL